MKILNNKCYFCSTSDEQLVSIPVRRHHLGPKAVSMHLKKKQGPAFNDVSWYPIYGSSRADEIQGI